MWEKLDVTGQILVSFVSIFLASLLVIICFVTASLGWIVNQRVHSEFNEIAKNNGNIIQNIFASVQRSNSYIANYNDTHYSNFNNSEIQDSQKIILGVQLNQEQANALDYYENYMYSTLQENSALASIGIYFTPYSFDKSLETVSYCVFKKVDEPKSVNDYGNTFREQYLDTDWYANVLNSKETDISKPYNEFEKNLIAISIPVLFDNRVVAIVRTTVYIDYFKQINFNSPDYKTMAAGIINNYDQYIFNNASDELTGKSTRVGYVNEDEYNQTLEYMKGNEPFSISITTPDGRNFKTFYRPLDVCGVNWWSYVSVSMADIMASARKVACFLGIISLISIGCAVPTIIFQLKRKLRPLEQLNNAATALENGDLSYDITYTENNIIGRTCLNIKNSFKLLHNVINEISLWMTALSNCDLTKDSAMEFNGEFVKIQTAYRSLLNTLNEDFQEIQVAANEINLGADQVASASQSLSQGNSEQAASVEQLSAMIEDITKNIKANSESSKEANELVNTVVNDVKESNTHMQSLTQAMEKINQSSDEVSKIIKTIDDIAFQTNLLALNAAIEAAHAGSSGKGFAVVAEEVRNLANKSAEAAKNIATLIATEIEAIEEGSVITTDTADSLQTVVKNVEAIKAKIDEISASSEDQANAVSQVNIGAEQISTVTQANSATSEQGAAASEELASQAQMLSDLVHKFQLK